MSDLATTVTVIDACGRAGVPVLLLSEPGVGKSSLIRSLATAEGVPCETVLGSIREPADIAGLPVVTESGVVLDPPAWAKRLRAAETGYLFLDELTTSPESVQAAMLAVALDRTVGDLRLPGAVRIVAGANPPDLAAGGYELSAPLANRFCHVTFAPTVEEWITGMLTGWATPPASRATGANDQRVAAIVTAVTGFINTRPDLLHAVPRDASATGGAWPSRRAWDMLARALAHLRDDDHASAQTLVFGLVGEGAGVEFLTWRSEADLPAAEDVLADPGIVEWSGRPDRVWAVLAAVVAWSASQGTVKAWNAAWGPLVSAAKDGAPDVAAAAARMHARSRPAKATIPATVRNQFHTVLVAAGLASEAGAA